MAEVVYCDKNIRITRDIEKTLMLVLLSFFIFNNSFI